jgi:prepilin-type N-terminal cleavage/methylation domain-containing protein
MKSIYSRRGFTLIELLVVIAIIAVLAAILFPVFAKAREKAWQTTCMNNQRQGAMTLMMYAQDHEETFFATSGDKSWTSMLNTQNGAYDCPALTGNATDGNPDYGMNISLTGMSIGDIEDPARTILLGDIFPTTSNTSYMIRDPNTDFHPRHSNALVFACVDGHVVTEKVDAPILGSLEAKKYLFFCAPKLLATINGPVDNPVPSPVGFTSWTYSALQTLPTDIEATANGLPNIRIEAQIGYAWHNSYGHQAGIRMLGLFLPNTGAVNNDGFYIGIHDVYTGFSNVAAGVGSNASTAGTLTKNEMPTYTWSPYPHYKIVVNIVNGKTALATVYSHTNVALASSAYQIPADKLANWTGRTKWAFLSTGHNGARVQNIKFYKLY